MSVENVTRFYEEVLQKNEQMVGRIQGADSPEAFSQMCVQLGQENGYNFTAKDVVAFLSQKKISEAPLDDRDLEAVAGGKGGSCPANTRLTVCFTVSGCWGSVC